VIGYLYGEQGNYREAQVCFEDARRIGTLNTNSELAAEALGGLALLSLRQGELHDALVHAEISVAQAKAARSEYALADALNHRGAARSALGEPGDRADYEESLARFQLLDNRFGVSRTLQSLAILELKHGNLAVARQHINASLDYSVNYSREMHQNGRAVHASLNLLGLLELLAGDIPAAKQTFLDLLDTARRMGVQTFVGYAYLGLAFCASRGGEPHKAIALHGAADTVFMRFGEALDAALQALRDADYRHLRRLAGETEFDSAYQTGQQLDTHSTVALATEA
jgi:tetratricopeptide (TPR) repeat protein